MERLADLEAKYLPSWVDGARRRALESASLREELSRLRPPPLPPPTLDGPFRVPSRAQIERLVGIVLRRFSLHQPKDRGIDDRFHAAVGAGMAFLGTVNRLPEGKVD
jgi:hypothetical protein